MNLRLEQFSALHIASLISQHWNLKRQKFNLELVKSINICMLIVWKSSRMCEEEKPLNKHKNIQSWNFVDDSVFCLEEISYRMQFERLKHFPSEQTVDKMQLQWTHFLSYYFLLSFNFMLSERGYFKIEICSPTRKLSWKLILFLMH